MTIKLHKTFVYAIRSGPGSRFFMKETEVTVPEMSDIAHKSHFFFKSVNFNPDIFKIYR